MSRIAALIAACHDKACAPPPVGTGGSTPESGSTGKPWSRPFSAGKWEPVNGRQALTDLFMSRYEDVLKNIPEGMHENFRKMFGEEVTLVVDELERQGSTVWVNGHLTIIDRETRLREGAKQRLLSTIDDLQTRFPTGAPLVEVQLVDDIVVEGRRAYGSTRIRRTDEDALFISLTYSEQNEEIAMPPQASDNWHQNTMSVHRGVWGMAHEWGHGHDRGWIDPNTSGALRSWAYQKVMDNPDLKEQSSRYARYDANEMYAESFADWSLSQGKTPNPVTKEFARMLGWKA